MTKAAAVLGINRAFIYHGIKEPETFEPVVIAIKQIAHSIDERLNRMKKRAAARSHFTAP